MLFYVDIETEHKLAILDLNTVEPPVSDHPKCEDFVESLPMDYPMDHQFGLCCWSLVIRVGKLSESSFRSVFFYNDPK